MSGGKKKKSTSTSSNNKVQKKKLSENSAGITTATTPTVESEENLKAKASPSATPVNSNSVDVLDRLAPPILFFPPNVSEEYLNRFCPAPSSSEITTNLLADEGFPDREIPVMRRLLSMMAGIMSKASAASARTYYSRVAGSEGRRNAYFQQNLNTSVFNLFSTLSAVGNTATGEVPTDMLSSSTSKDLHLTPAAAFTAKDGESLRGYPQRLMKFWRQLSLAEQVRLVREEHAALTNAWIESRQSWCLCSHCKHRRMTISDLTDCLYQTYCEELESFIQSGGQGSTLYSINLNSSTDPAAKMRRFLFKSLSVVGEQALLPRYNQFILRLEAFSAMAFSNAATKEKPNNSNNQNTSKNVNVNLNSNTSSSQSSKMASSFKSAALQASKEFLQKHGNKKESEVKVDIEESFDPKNFLKGLSFKLIHDSDEELEEFVASHRTVRASESEPSDSEGDGEDGQDSNHQGGIQSEDDDDLIDEETDLPIDESELMLPGGASFPLLPIGDGPVQWSESSRIECGRTVFLMFASEMFQYRLTSAYLAHQTRLRQLALLAEVEAEERIEKEKMARADREKKERAEVERKKKAAKKEKAAAANNGKKKNVTVKDKLKSKGDEPVTATATGIVAVDVDVTVDAVVPSVDVSESTEPVLIEPVESVLIDTIVSMVPESLIVEPVAIESKSAVESVLFATTTTSATTATFTSAPEESIFTKPLSHFASPIPASSSAPADVDMDDFDPNELIEELSKEMYRFEMQCIDQGRVDSNTPAPPGFAPPPGFTISGPIHLDPQASAPTDLFKGYPRPPFMAEEIENRYYNSPNRSGIDRMNHSQYHSHNHNQSHSPYQNHHHLDPYCSPSPSQAYYPQVDYPPYANDHTHSNNHTNNHNNPAQQHQPPFYHQKFDPFQQEQEQEQQQQNSPPSASSDGQSRFQSFFSKSIFGPSSFFSQ